MKPPILRIVKSPRDVDDKFKEEKKIESAKPSLKIKTSPRLPVESLPVKGKKIEKVKGTKKEKEMEIIFNREAAEDSIRYFNITVTGIRPGEYIHGLGSAKDAQMKVIAGMFPPNREYILNIEHFPDLWDVFMNKLGNISFFSELTTQEREEWFTENSEFGDKYLSDVLLEVEFTNVGSGDFIKKLDESTIERLTAQSEEPNIWKIKAVEDLFPAKPGSKGLKGRHTLILRPSLWQVLISYQKVDKFDGLCFSVEDGFVSKGYLVKTGEDILVFDGISKDYSQKGESSTKTSIGNKKKGVKYEKETTQQIGIIIQTQKAQLKEEIIFPIILKLFNGKYTIKNISDVKSSMYNFTAAGYKSLLQKIIRLRSKNIHLPDVGDYESSFVLVVCCALLLIHPGSFVPDIQRFVSGLESVAKRLVVTAFEDSWLNSKDEFIALSCMISGFLAQRVKEWRPSIGLVEKYFQLAINLFNETRYYNYSIEEGMKTKNYVLSEKNTTLQNISAFLDDLRSFGSDLGMVRNIAGNPKFSKSNLQQISSIPIYHCIDQHWAPEIAYYTNYNLVIENIQTGAEPFGLLFSRIFRELTGINGRKEILDLDDPFVTLIQDAQRLVLLSKQKLNQKANLEVISKKNFNFELDRSWIAGMLGAIEIRQGLVMINPNNIDELVAVKRPSREDKSGGILSEEKKFEYIFEARNLLRKGISLNKTKAPIEELNGAILYRREDTDDEENVTVKYFIETKNGVTEWDSFRMLNKVMNITKGNKKLSSLEESLLLGLHENKTITDNGDVMLKKLLSVTEPAVVRRVLKYLDGYKSEFEMNRISRDGGATGQSVIMEDVGAFQFLMTFSIICPLALRRIPEYPLKFRMNFAPLLWSIRDSIQEEYSSVTTSSKKWGTIKDSSDRIPWEHQTDAFDEMVVNHNKGRRGHFLWIPVRMGKTYIVLRYLQFLKEQGKLPKYVIYASPPEAIKAMFTEISMFGFEINVCIPVKGKKSDLLFPNNTVSYCTPDKYKVTIIQHDHLRKCEQELLEIAPDSIFIFDEVHKALNETQRTNAALSISSLASEFIVLTGTPIIDTHTYKLAWWLSQIVPFEVNEKNFWVAAAGMVAKKVTTGIIINKEEIIAKFEKKEAEEYSKLVPPALGGTNSRVSITDINKSMKVSYSAASREMVVQVSEFLKKKIGVLLVAKDIVMQDELQSMLVTSGVNPKDIFVMKKDKSIYLTDEAVAEGKVHDYKVVITTIRLAQGYTVNRLRGMVTSVYPSNQATREQMEGRILKYTDERYHVYIKIVHCGILTHILKNHNSSNSLSAALSALAKDINISEL